MLATIVKALFPQTSNIVIETIGKAGLETISRTTADELQVCKKIKDTKAPKPDEISNEAVKAVAHVKPDMLIQAMQKCLHEMVSLSRGNKQHPSEYRPICLLDTMGKILAGIIANRFCETAEHESALFDMQFGFRKGPSSA